MKAKIIVPTKDEFTDTPTYLIDRSEFKTRLSPCRKSPRRRSLPFQPRFTSSAWRGAISRESAPRSP